MTRKRYVKLLMSTGYSRNQANFLAKFAAQSGSYQRAWDKDFRHKIMYAVKSLFNSLTPLISKWWNQLKPLLNSVELPGTERDGG
ncbi:MAG TPA: hypothetical protein VHP31_12185 [Caproicibacter sp.]|nr:hypothetical protein [Caproicibacter sp.]